jgi:hypothetical protein
MANVNPPASPEEKVTKQLISLLNATGAIFPTVGEKSLVDWAGEIVAICNEAIVADDNVIEHNNRHGSQRNYDENGREVFNCRRYRVRHHRHVWGGDPTEYRCEGEPVLMLDRLCECGFRNSKHPIAGCQR